MSADAGDGGDTDGGDAGLERQALRAGWWLQFLQVRLRFVLLVALTALVMAQWDRLQRTVGGLLLRVSGQQLSGEIASDHEYFCPMDPGVLSAWPAICSICNMDLVPRRKGDAELLPEGVVARMQLSPFRIQLAGLRTTVVAACQSPLVLTLQGVLRMNGSVESGQWLELPVSRQDVCAFAEPVGVLVSSSVFPDGVSGTAVRVVDGAASVPLVRVSLAEPLRELPEGLLAVTVRAEVAATKLLSAEQRGMLGERTLLQVPTSAVVEHGESQLVYVQTMAGMFDGRVVQLGPRTGSAHLVIGGLDAGEQVVSTGAFLVDAEARLNPALAVGYFGADQPALSSAAALAPLKVAAAKSGVRVLSESELALAEAQGKCPVTDLSLDSMGGPVPVRVGERTVFICCAACERKLLKEPEKYLAKLPPPVAGP
ncbi:MAG: heavy metal-binding domain-containing protein [Planctomyces sp.]